MDILDFYSARKPERQRALEELLLDAARDALAQINKRIERCSAKLTCISNKFLNLDYETQSEVFALSKEELDKARTYAAILYKQGSEMAEIVDRAHKDRRHFLKMLCALHGDPHAYKHDTLIRWPEVDQVRTERADLQSIEQPEDNPSLPAPIPSQEEQSRALQEWPFASRRGRPARHKWAELTAATVERCLNGPVPLQEDLVREMLEWCIEHWGEEPALSHVRAYVAPTFKKFEAHWQKASATEHAEKSGHPDEHITGRDFSA